MKLVLTVVILAGVILYGFLNTHQRGTDEPTLEDSTELQPSDDTESETDDDAEIEIEDQEPSNDVPPTSTPTATPVTPTIAPTPMPTSSPEAQKITSARKMHCDQPGCISWTHQITVPHTMNRWEIWSQFIGSGMMSWDRFAYEVEIVNPTLKLDGHMFKVHKTYQLPECVDMGDH